MGHCSPCRVQWVARPNQMAEVVERLTRSGGILVARSGYDVPTEDLDVLNDAETGRLSIAEFKLDPIELTRQVLTACADLGPGETLLIDLTGPRYKVQVLPVPSNNVVIVRRNGGLRRFRRSHVGLNQWLGDQFSRAMPVTA
jgi:hypothetical protein